MARSKNYFHRFRSTSRGEGLSVPATASSGITATGGTAFQPGNGYKYHFFTSSGSLVVSAVTGPGAIDYLIVGGGGAGGTYPSGNSGGGGGAGGFVTDSSTLSAQTYPVTIGEGTFNSITAYGGGGGSPSYGSPGNPGASGGGGGGNGPTTGGQANKIQPGGGSIPAPLQPQGNNGGTGGPANNSGRSGGGGGAGAAGQAGNASGNSGAGGEGKSAFDGDTGIPTDYGTAHPSQPGRWFAGGGAGGGYPSAAINTEPGGVGGGGSSLSGVPLNGVDGTGGGGGGNQGPTAGDGGDGIVIIRYSA